MSIIPGCLAGLGIYVSKGLVDFDKLSAKKQKDFSLCIWGFIGLFVIWIVIASWTQYKSCTQFAELDHKIDKNSYDMTVLFTSNRNWKDKSAIIIQSWKQYHNQNNTDLQNRIKSLINSREEREREARSIAEKEEELADVLRLQWVPFLEIILAYFDDNILALQKQGIQVELTKTELPELIQFNNTKSDNVILRKVIFPNGSSIEIETNKAAIFEGRLVSFLVVHFKDTNMPSGAFQLVFRKEMSMLSGLVGVHKETKEPPLHDQEFVVGVKEAINGLIDRVYDYDEKVNRP